MTTVEELRDGIYKRVVGLVRGIGDDLDSLISAARAEGESEIRAIFDVLWSRMQEWEGEWRAENPKERRLTSPDSMQLIEWKIAKARAEGAEQGLQMAQRWIDGELIQNRHVISLPTDALLASVLAPKEKP